MNMDKMHKENAGTSIVLLSVGVLLLVLGGDLTPYRLDGPINKILLFLGLAMMGLGGSLLWLVLSQISLLCMLIGHTRPLKDAHRKQFHQCRWCGKRFWYFPV